MGDGVGAVVLVPPWIEHGHGGGGDQQVEESVESGHAPQDSGAADRLQRTSGLTAAMRYSNSVIVFRYFSMYQRFSLL